MSSLLPIFGASAGLKRNIVIDLSKPKGREIVLKMLADADMLIARGISVEHMTA